MQCLLSEIAGIKLVLSDCSVLLNLQFSPAASSGSSEAPQGLCSGPHCSLQHPCCHVNPELFPADAVCTYLLSQLADSPGFARDPWGEAVGQPPVEPLLVRAVLITNAKMKPIHSKEAQPNRKWYLNSPSRLGQMLMFSRGL